MKPIQLVLFILFFIYSFNLSFAQQNGMVNNTNSPHMKLKSVDLDDCKWTTGFWANKFDVCNKVMIPNMWKLLNDKKTSHIYQNFLVAAGIEKGEFRGFTFHDGDFYKFVEALSYAYSVTKDEKTKQQLDEIIDVISKAQREDGYITNAIVIGHGHKMKFDHSLGGAFKKEKAFQKDGDHELYNFGHLMTAACIHYRATGQSNFLDVAKKAADFLYEYFHIPSPELAAIDWNPPHYMGLVEMYRTTGNKKYLELAEIFINMLGTANYNAVPRGLDHSQKRIPFREETKAVGHAGHANYMYCGIADIYAENGDSTLFNPLHKIWEDVAYKKMYVTGATGTHNRTVSNNGIVGEAYGMEYELANSRAYSETCANIENAMWNWRMFLLNGESKYADILETVLYNSGLSGISLEGKDFFYTNPMRYQCNYPDHSSYKGARRPYINCFCCPPNIVRTIAKVQNYAYSTSKNGVWVNLYGSNVLDTKLNDGSRLKLTQNTNYPWDGLIKIKIDTILKKKFSMMLRIPSWANKAELKVNGKNIQEDLLPGSYFKVNRTWENGDIIELNIPMEAMLIKGNPFAEDISNQVAVKRGPVVYCLESIDLPKNVKVTDIVIPQNIKLKPHFNKNLLSEVVTLNGKAKILPQENWSNQLYKKNKRQKLKKTAIKLIPYYSWSNRGSTDMTVWMPITY